MTEALFSTVELESVGGINAGFRLDRFEVLNWGTFDRKVWVLRTHGANSLLTGDIGSGKSTIVDGLTTLLVTPQKVQYNRAAGAESKERTLRSYVQGHYSAERNEATGKSRPVGLRPDASSYSVLLGVFTNAALNATVSLAVVFWIPDGNTSQPPERLYAIADRDLTIAGDFSEFGTDIASLRKRLRTVSGARDFTSFTEYGKELRRSLGIPSEQAMELFHQTISMKSVGDLNDFVRQHMLERFDVRPKIEALIAHFDDLTKAHEAVRKARDQLAALDPILLDGSRYDDLTTRLTSVEAEQEALAAFIATGKAEYLRLENDRLETLIETLAAQIGAAAREIESLATQLTNAERAREGLGGARLGEIERRLPELDALRTERERRAETHRAALAAAGLLPVNNDAQYLARQREMTTLAESLGVEAAELDGALSEHRVTYAAVETDAKRLNAELLSLRERKNKIPSDLLLLRRRMCESLMVAESEMPYAGELLRVAEDSAAWEGAAERLLRGFALSLIVPNEHYRAVSAWVNANHLGGRLVYLHVPASLRPDSHLLPSSNLLLARLELKDDSPYLPWLRREIARRADYECAEDVDQLRVSSRAITREGQIKHGNGRHEKDDRRPIDDRANYVLGWSNEQKVAALLDRASGLNARLQLLATLISELQEHQAANQQRRDAVVALRQSAGWAELDWHSVAAEMLTLQAERDQIVGHRAELAEIDMRIAALKADITASGRDREKLIGDRAVGSNQLTRNLDELEHCEAALVEVDPEVMAATFARLSDRVHAHEHSHQTRWDDLRSLLGSELVAEQSKLLKDRSTVSNRIESAMSRFRDAWHQETLELDASVDALGGFRALHDRLVTDDLPRFEAEFKNSLNENTIREVAMFQAMLNKQRDEIKDRIRTINGSLVGIDYNRDTYIELEPRETPNQEIRDFRRDLAEATDSSLSTDRSDQYSEEKFLQVSRIIERFRGRDGQAEADRTWTRRVTDVREWFVFAASERNRADGSEREHYTSSGGKSGGQKEKLAYTILAASLAYQFKLEGDRSTRSFRFVVIDEAFGRGSDASTRFGMELFGRLGLQLLIVTPLQKIRVIEPYVSAVGFVDNESGRYSRLHSMTISEYHERRHQFATARARAQ